jgi:quinohemoprotein ethanol dehydrogenase
VPLNLKTLQSLLFIVASAGMVMFAADARSGQTKWCWDPDIPREPFQGLCCGPVNRGVALYNGLVYAGLLDGSHKSQQSLI